MVLIRPSKQATFLIHLQPSDSPHTGSQAVTLRRCPHLSPCKLCPASKLLLGGPCADGCPCGEVRVELELMQALLRAVGSPRGCLPPLQQWICLLCGESRCSRYMHGHSLKHWEATAAAAEPSAATVPVCKRETTKSQQHTSCKQSIFRVSTS